MDKLEKAIYNLDSETVDKILKSDLNIYKIDWEKYKPINSLFTILSSFSCIYEDKEAKGINWSDSINLTKARNILLLLVEAGVYLPIIYRYDISAFSQRSKTIVVRLRERYNEIEENARKALLGSFTHITPLIDIVLSYYRG